MNLKRMIFRATLLIGAATLLMFAGCGIPGAQAGEVGGAVNRATTITSNQTGTDSSDNFYYSFWKGSNETNYTGPASLTINTGTKGNYSTSWGKNGTNVSNFTAGKGWSKGSPTRVIKYSGSFDGGANGYLALYGWATTSVATPANYSVVEYYVVENYGQWTPPGGTSLGTFSSDGGTYNIYKMTRTNQPWIVNGNNGTFYQYWSVRTSKQSSGTITFANHLNAWANAGLKDINSVANYYQIMETEGYHSSGSSNITVSEGSTLGVPFYRFWTGANTFYSTNMSEGLYYGFTYEGIACNVNTTQVSGTTPYYRLWNGADTLYTISLDEANNAYYYLGYYLWEANACYVYSTQVSGTIPFYRFFNGTDHFLTTSMDEGYWYGYTYEGVSCYVFPAN